MVDLWTRDAFWPMLSVYFAGRPMGGGECLLAKVAIGFVGWFWGNYGDDDDDDDDDEGHCSCVSL